MKLNYKKLHCIIDETRECFQLEIYFDFPHKIYGDKIIVSALKLLDNKNENIETLIFQKKERIIYNELPGSMINVFCFKTVLQNAKLY